MCDDATTPIMRGATVHLFHCKEGDIADDQCEIAAELLKRYPGARERIRNGDIIEFTKSSGYRTAGVYMARVVGSDITVIQLDYRYDDYGTISPIFVTLRDFPPGYWDAQIEDDTFARGKVSKFYWRGFVCDSLHSIDTLRTAVVDETGARVVFFEGKKYTIDFGASADAWENLMARGADVIGRLAHRNDGDGPCNHIVIAAD
jgi:hypothetical protein